jgi:two-component system, cell cycle sensor histidine kinase and response regulator CckA
MTGPELAAALRERYPDLKVVYMSGYAAVLDDDANLVQKPFNRDTLLTAIQRAWQ